MLRTRLFFLLFLLVFSLFFLSNCGFSFEDAAPESSGPTGPFAVLFDIDGEMPQFSSSTGGLSAPILSQYRLTELIEKAKNDLRVQEIIVRIGNPTISMARAQELVDALLGISLAGKPLVCHIDAVDNVGYWIAAQGCPKIAISPAGWIEILGLSMEMFYARELLSTVGVSAEMINVGTYKDAAEPFTRDSMSDSSREAANAILQGVHSVFVNGIAKGRKLESIKVQALIDNGPHDAPTAKTEGMVDEITPLEAILSRLVAKYQGGVVHDYGKPPKQQLSMSDVLKLFGGDDEKKKESANPRIALVPVIGPITGGSEEDLFGGTEMVRDRALTKTLADLERDTTVKAVVLRIDSPGGSALASDNIWHAVRALAKTKPVIASLGDVAASGGYYIAAGATEIYAEPATLTGSIGVVGGKLVFNEAVERIGIHPERLTTGRRAGLMSPFSKFTDDERQAIDRLMKVTYKLFVDRVATGRNMSRENVLQVAEGRVWTGLAAQKSGLVNQLGGLNNAVERARELAKVPAGTPVEIVPKPKSLIEILGEALSEPQAKLTRTLSKRHPAIAHGFALASLLANEQVLTFAPFSLSIR